MKKLTAILISLFLSFTILTFPSLADDSHQTLGEDTPFPDISAQAYVLADSKTGEIIFSHNENMRLPIASTTKIMTCLVALENAELSDLITVDTSSIGIEGSSIYLMEGEVLTLKDLLYGLMLESANDCAVCIANYISGSIEAFSDLMNSRAKEIGVKNTHFNNPHGLENAEHYSTAYDMALIWNEAMKNDDFRNIVSAKSYRIDMGEDNGYRFLTNHNKLLKTYDSCIGGKTGYTKTAGRCLVSGAKCSDAELVMVTLNAPNDWNDHVSLLEYTMSMYTTLELAGDSSVMHVLPVVGGKMKNVNLKNKEPLSLTIRDITKLEVTLHAPRFIYAPITDTNTPVAEIVYTVGGVEIASLPLYPESTVELNEKPSFFKRIINFFK